MIELFRKAVSPSVLNCLSTSKYCALWTIQNRHYAARKGTRAKMDRKKKSRKVEEKKVEFIPHVLRERGVKGVFTSQRIRDDFKSDPLDDVYIMRFYKYRTHSLEEAVKCHKETHHPQIYNMMDSYIRALIELDMSTSKKTKFVDPFTRISKVDHKFDIGEERSILVFCKTKELKDQAEANGATMVGDGDLVKKIERGEVVLPDFNFIIAHPNILPELVCLKGLLKRKFPSPKVGTLGMDIAGIVHRFKYGIQYSASRDDREMDYGRIDTPIGMVNMETGHLEKNFQNLVQDILSVKVKKTGPFITRVFLTCPPSTEKLKIEFEKYLPEEEKDSYESDSDDEKAAKVSN